MKQLKLKALDSEGPEGIFLVRVEAATYRWHGRKPFLHLQFSILAPSERRGQLIRAGLDHLCEGGRGHEAHVNRRQHNSR